MQQGDVHQHGSHDPVSAPWWKTRSGVVLCGFLLVAAFYLLTEHTAHLFGVLPYLLILACPLMHLFMHHGHGGHGAGQSSKPPVTDRDQAGAP
jgi:peptidoglycan/LPS O-acetylase OafA/YrhL